MKITIDAGLLESLIEKHSGLNVAGVSMNITFLEELKSLKIETYNTPNKLNKEIEHDGKIYIRLLKSGGYRSKDGTIKKPIFIKGIPYAPKDDIK